MEFWPPNRKSLPSLWCSACYVVLIINDAWASNELCVVHLGIIWVEYCKVFTHHLSIRLSCFHESDENKADCWVRCTPCSLYLADYIYSYSTFIYRKIKYVTPLFPLTFNLWAVTFSWSIQKAWKTRSRNWVRKIFGNKYHIRSKWLSKQIRESVITYLITLRSFMKSNKYLNRLVASSRRSSVPNC